LWACGSGLSRLALLSQVAGVAGVALGALATCDPGVTLISLEPLGTNGPRFALGSAERGFLNHLPDIIFSEAAGTTQGDD
jgi:hypothetical protein